ncbi:MAG: hypothetical protein ACFFBD_25430, partial [Candidatus Hodarchaeota archaeon]
MPKDVQEFEYPTKVTKGRVLKGLWQASKLDAFFHGLMAILLITGLIILSKYFSTKQETLITVGLTWIFL